MRPGWRARRRLGPGARRGVAGLALALLAAAPALAAEVLDPVKVAEVEAAFLVNFLRYTEWPAGSFAAADAPYVVTVVGSDAVAVSLAAIAERAQSVAGRRLEVRRTDLPRQGSAQWRRLAEDLRRSHLVFLGETAAARVPDLLAEVAGSDVLTVGDLPRFAAAGGMIGLRRAGSRIVFEANPEAIRQTRLVVSARVLKLARIVERRPGP